MAGKPFVTYHKQPRAGQAGLGSSTERIVRLTPVYLDNPDTAKLARAIISVAMNSTARLEAA